MVIELEWQMEKKLVWRHIVNVIKRLQLFFFFLTEKYRPCLDSWVEYVQIANDHFVYWYRVLFFIYLFLICLNNKREKNYKYLYSWVDANLIKFDILNCMNVIYQFSICWILKINLSCLFYKGKFL